MLPYKLSKCICMYFDDLKLTHNFSDNQGILIPTRSGKKFLLMLDEHTYSQVNYSTYWVCSSTKSFNCKARVRRTEDGAIHRVEKNHTHPPPKYIYKNGQYIKI